MPASSSSFENTKTSNRRTLEGVRNNAAKSWTVGTNEINAGAGFFTSIGSTHGRGKPTRVSRGTMLYAAGTSRSHLCRAPHPHIPRAPKTAPRPAIKSIEKRRNIVVAELRSKVNAMTLIYSRNAAPASNSWRNTIVAHSRIEINARVPLCS